MNATFTIMEVVQIVVITCGLVATYFALRSQIGQVKYDTGVVREWAKDGVQQLSDLHEWHSPTDGRFKWIMSQQFEDAIVSIAETNKDLVRLLEYVNERNKEILETVLRQQHG